MTLKLLHVAPCLFSLTNYHFIIHVDYENKQIVLRSVGEQLAQTAVEILK